MVARAACLVLAQVKRTSWPSATPADLGSRRSGPAPKLVGLIGWSVHAFRLFAIVASAVVSKTCGGSPSNASERNAVPAGTASGWPGSANRASVADAASGGFGVYPISPVSRRSDASRTAVRRYSSFAISPP